MICATDIPLQGPLIAHPGKSRTDMQGQLEFPWPQIGCREPSGSNDVSPPPLSTLIEILLQSQSAIKGAMHVVSGQTGSESPPAHISKRATSQSTYNRETRTIPGFPLHRGPRRTNCVFVSDFNAGITSDLITYRCLDAQFTIRASLP